jgi:16S rRNA (uracil1498-N3)-methyltransferase
VRVHRVHLARLEEGEMRLSGSDAHHLAHVLRVKPGSKVEAFDGHGLEAEGEVVRVDDLSVTLRLGPAVRSAAEPALRLTLAVALLKGDKLADVVRMGTELGVYRFQPFTSRYGEVKTLSPAKLERWRRVAREAAKQSGRSVVPEVAEPIPLKALEPGEVGIVAHPYAEITLASLVAAGAVTLVSGPEGGLHDDEVALLTRRGFTAVTLGPRILRAETAPIAMTAALLLPPGW